jgi:hypothetical protein
MKQVTELFPGWLQDNKSKLSEDDFSKWVRDELIEVADEISVPFMMQLTVELY